MATNPYVNKVQYGDQTIMDISDTTAIEEDVLSGKTFYKANGAKSVGTGTGTAYTAGDGINIENATISLDMDYLTASRLDVISANEKGVNNGVATLDANGKVPAVQLPSPSDDSYISELLYSHYEHNNDYTSTYTATEAGRVLAVVIDIVHNVQQSHNTSASITTTGTIKKAKQETTNFTSMYPETRDATIRFALIDVNIGDTITLSNSNLTTRADKTHLIFKANNIYDIETKYFDTVVDNKRDNSKTIALDSSYYYFLWCQQLYDTNAMANIASSGITKYSYNHTDPSDGNRISIMSVKNTDSVTYQTADISNYISKVYGVWRIIGISDTKLEWGNIEGTISNQTDLQAALNAKTNKVNGATNGNFAALDSNGNLVDSGHKHSDYLTNIPIASANTLGGIKVGSNLSIDENGVLSAGGSESVSWGDIEGTLSDQADLRNVLDNCYQSTDTTEIGYGFENDDKIPFYSSSTNTKKNTTWSNFKSKISNALSTTYARLFDVRNIMKDTVGWVAKNVVPLTIDFLKTINTRGTWTENTYTDRGITYTISVNDSGYVTEIVAGGTATDSSALYLLYGTVSKYEGFLPTNSTYTMNGCALGGDQFTKFSMQFTFGWDAYVLTDTSDISFDYYGGSSTGVYWGIYVVKDATLSNKKFQPMLRRATENSYFQAYHPPVELCKFNRTEQRVLGAKNRLEYNLDSIKPYNTSGTWNDNAYTSDGITFTVNSDGSVSVSGTATADASLILKKDNSQSFVGEKISGCPSNGSINTYFMRVQLADSPYSSYATDVGNGGKIKPYTNEIMIFICIKNGQTVNNLIFKPMLRLASDPDDTYVPYAMTNRELTEFVKRTKLLGTDDLDTVFGYGDYYWENTYPVHAPENQTFGSMRVYPCGEITYQEIIRASGVNAIIYLRRYQNSWSSWYKFSGTVVS